MKPVQLMPTHEVVQVETPGSSSAAAAIIVGGLMVLGVGGYFAMAKVEDVKAKTTTITAQATEAETTATTLSQQIQEAGKKRDWSVTSKTYADAVVSRVNDRVDYARITRELAATDIVAMGGWFQSVSVANPDASGAGAGSGSDAITLNGYLPSMYHVAALVSRLNATSTIDDAHLVDWSYKTAIDRRRYVFFNIGAGIDTSDSSVGEGLISNGDSGGKATELVLEPEPGYDRRQAEKNRKKPEPKLTSLEKLVRDTRKAGGVG